MCSGAGTDVIIDSFTTNQIALASATDPLVVASGAAAGALSGNRDLVSNLFSGASLLTRTSAGQLTVAHGANSEGITAVQWDGAEGTAALGAFAPQDLTVLGTKTGVTVTVASATEAYQLRLIMRGGVSGTEVEDVRSAVQPVSVTAREVHFPFLTAVPAMVAAMELRVERVGAPTSVMTVMLDEVRSECRLCAASVALAVGDEFPPSGTVVPMGSTVTVATVDGQQLPHGYPLSFRMGGTMDGVVRDAFVGGPKAFLGREDAMSMIIDMVGANVAENFFEISLDIIKVVPTANVVGPQCETLPFARVIPTGATGAPLFALSVDVVPMSTTTIGSETVYRSTVTFNTGTNGLRGALVDTSSIGGVCGGFEMGSVTGVESLRYASLLTTCPPPYVTLGPTPAPSVLSLIHI